MASSFQASIVTGLRHAVRVATPVVRAAGRHARRMMGRLGREIWARRRVLWPASHRALWWTALVLLLVGGRPVLGAEALPDRTVVLAPFVAGLVLCGLVRLWSPARRLRIAALLLGSVHGVAVVLVGTAFGG